MNKPRKPTPNMIKVIADLTKNSIHSKWEEVRLEWELQCIEYVDTDEAEGYSMQSCSSACICDHGIKEWCWLHNRFTDHTRVIGNCCIKQVLPQFDSHKIFDCIRRMLDNPSSSMNVETALYAYEHGIINAWEHGFYLSIWRRRSLTPKQEVVKLRINQKVLKKICKGH